MSKKQKYLLSYPSGAQECIDTLDGLILDGPHGAPEIKKVNCNYEGSDKYPCVTCQ